MPDSDTTPERPVTRLGRAFAGCDPAPQPPPRTLLSRTGRRHTHTGGADWFRDVILGGQDGLVNILGIILGVISGGGNHTVLLALDSQPPSPSRYPWGRSATRPRLPTATSTLVETAEVRDDPDLERREVTELYRSKGFSGALLERVVATITANREKWVDTILEEERHLHPVGTKDVMRSSVVITVATLVGYLIPLFPFLFLATTPALVLAIVLSAVVLFGVGAYQAITRVGSWWKQGPRMVLIGLGAAALGYLIGRLFNASGG